MPHPPPLSLAASQAVEMRDAAEINAVSEGGCLVDVSGGGQQRLRRLWPCHAAITRAALPLEDVLLTPLPPASSACTAVWPKSAASISAVRPPSKLEFEVEFYCHADVGAGGQQRLRLTCQGLTKSILQQITGCDRLPTHTRTGL